MVGRREFFSLGFLRKKSRDSSTDNKAPPPRPSPERGRECVEEEQGVPSRASFSLEEFYSRRQSSGAAFDPMPAIAVRVLPEDYDVVDD